VSQEIPPPMVHFKQNRKLSGSKKKLKARGEKKKKNFAGKRS